MKIIYVTETTHYVGKDNPKADKLGFKHLFEVTKLINSVAYPIGKKLEWECVADLCDQTEIWKVVVE